MWQINYRMRVTLNDGRQMTGQMLAFDKVSTRPITHVVFHTNEQHMNLVLADTEEFRRTKRKSKPSAGPSNAPLVESEEKRTLGLTIVRGTHVVSCSVDGPPPADPSARLGTSAPGAAAAAATLSSGPGISKPAGRGLPVGLGGPAAGVGGPAPPGGFGGFPPGGFPGGPPPGFPGRGGPPGGPRKSSLLKKVKKLIGAAGFAPPPGFAPQGAPRTYYLSSESVDC